MQKASDVKDSQTNRRQEAVREQNAYKKQMKSSEIRMISNS